MNGRVILVKPLINEKSMALTSLGFYTFKVDKNASKDQIAKVVASKFDVNVISVKTINIEGKLRSYRSRRGHFQLSGIKKAIVKIEKGQKIALFEAPAEEEVVVKTAEGEPIAKTKEKKSLLKGTKVKIEKTEEKAKHKEEPRKGARQTGKEKGEK